MTTTVGEKATITAVNALTSRVNADSDSMSVVQSDISSLEATLDSSGSIFNAIDGLQQDITDDSTGLNALQSKITSLNSTVSGKASTSSVSNLSNQINHSETGLSALNSDIVSLAATVNHSDTGLAATVGAVSSLETRIDETDSDISVISGDLSTLSSGIGDQIATATSGLVTTATLNSAIGSIPDVSAKYFVDLDVNGHFAGFELNNNGVTSDFVLTADKFKVVTGSSSVAPFEVSGNTVKLSNAEVTGGLNIGSGTGQRMEIKDTVLKIFDNSGNIRVKLGDLTS